MKTFKTLRQFAAEYVMADVSLTETICINEDSEHGGVWRCELVVSGLGKSVELFGTQLINAGEYRYLDNNGSGNLNFSSLWNGN